MSGAAPVPPTSSTMVGNLLSTFERWNKVPDSLGTSFCLPRLASPLLIGGEVCTISWNIVCVPFETLGKVVTSPFLCCSVRCKKISDWNKSLHPLSTVYKILKLVIGLIASAFLAWSIVSWNLRFHSWLNAGYATADLSLKNDPTVTRLNGLVAVGNATIANKDRLIDEKQGSVDFLKLTAAQFVVNKDQEIEKLNAEIRSREQEKKKLQERITLLESTQASAERDMKATNAISKDTAAAISLASSAFSEQDARIRDLSAQVVQHQQTIDKYLRTIDAREATIVGHEQALSGKDEAIATLEQDVASLAGRIAVLQNVQATSEADSKVNNSVQIAQLQEALKAKEQELHSKISEISSLTGRITRLEEQAADQVEKQRELIAKEAKLKAQEADQAEHQTQLDDKQEEIDFYISHNEDFLAAKSDKTFQEAFAALKKLKENPSSVMSNSEEDEKLAQDDVMMTRNNQRLLDHSKDLDAQEADLLSDHSTIPTVGSDVAGSSNVPTDSSAQSNNAEATDANGITLAISSEAQQPNPVT